MLIELCGILFFMVFLILLFSFFLKEIVFFVILWVVKSKGINIMNGGVIKVVVGVIEINGDIVIF